MVLVIPAIDILRGKSASGLEGPGDDPFGIARLLRIENAKALHVTDLAGAQSLRFGEFELFQKIVETFDIPVEASGGVGSMEDAARLVDIGACRVVLHPGMLTEKPEVAKTILETLGPSTVVASIESGPTGSTGPRRLTADEAVEAARGAAALGFRRLLVTQFDEAGHTLDPAMLGRLTAACGLRITVSGGIRSFEDLMEVQKLERLGIDSVILRKSLYENVFACQKIWRMAERENFPFTAKVPVIPKEK